MFLHLNTLSDRPCFLFRKKTTLTLLAVCLAYGLSSAHTQAQGSFNSGSTGADGAFSPVASQTIQLPESGIFNYTTVTIPSGVTISYKRNSRNTPVTILATGNVVINGTINVNGKSPVNSFWGGFGGPGGFDGGAGGEAQRDGFNGNGPGGGKGGRYVSGNQFGAGGGGYATAGSAGFGAGGGAGGIVYGVPTLIPLIGGSGGGGSSGAGSSRGSSGGGGGGAILIASSGSISGSGTIAADGGCGVSAGSGSGGAIRLAANSLIGNLSVSAAPSGCGSSGGVGYIRFETFDLSGFNPGVNPQASIGSPRLAVPTNAPQLKIVTIAGINAPNTPTGSLITPDIVLPSTTSGPVTVALAANNLPLGTLVDVTVVPNNGAMTTVQSTPLSGSQASSTATATVTLPSGASLFYASAALDLALVSSLRPIFIEGERVRKMEISATFGGASEITYITESGKRIKRTSE